ncbi:MAG TPA: lactate racemase domain-containing protein [Isosphaeraceae bacterium]|nr:lactate racemase domain-containing protein [Isosphaeraceae bacterium]
MSLPSETKSAFPLVARVRRSYGHQPELADAPRAVFEVIGQSRLRERVRPGGAVAITVGSRGIAGISDLVRAAVDGVKAVGLEPFLLAAMGSHGGGTPEGQRALLAELGITEESAGCPLRTEIEAEVVGTNSLGLPIHFDRQALRADGILLLNRIKPHTSFSGRFESGLLKMLTVGLGKREGAAQVHKLGLSGLRTLLPEVGAYLLKQTPVALGIGLVENAREHTARVVPVEPEDLLEVEPGLLEEARRLMGRLPFDQIDVLIVGELGKNYSGTGLDPNVIGRQRVETMPDLPRPIVTRLAVLDVAPESRGNALGIGLADLTTDRLVQAIDPVPMRVNSLTSNFLTRARVPISLPTDSEVLGACLDTCWRLSPLDVRMVLIPNTLELETLWVTRPLAGDVEADPSLHFETDFQPLPVDERGRLDQEHLFPESTQGRRAGAGR